MALTLKRIAAYLLDIVIAFVALAPLGFGVQLLLGFSPADMPSQQMVYPITLLNFSLPVWVYFTLADASKWQGTLGKRIMRLQVSNVDGARLTIPRALGRTAIKLLPWEIIHFSAFALATSPGTFTTVQAVGIIIGNVLTFAYLIVCFVQKGQRSVHDLAAGTQVS